MRSRAPGEVDLQVAVTHTTLLRQVWGEYAVGDKYNSATWWGRSARSPATTRPIRATSSTNRGSGTGFRPDRLRASRPSPLTGEGLLLQVASVQQVGRDQGDKHDSGRPPEAGSERVEWREVEPDRKAADGSEDGHDQSAAHVAVPLPVELPADAPRTAVGADPVRRGGRVGRDSSSVLLARDLLHRRRRQVLDLAVGRGWHLERFPERVLPIRLIHDPAQHAQCHASQIDPGRV